MSGGWGCLFGEKKGRNGFFKKTGVGLSPVFFCLLSLFFLCVCWRLLLIMKGCSGDVCLRF